MRKPPIDDNLKVMTNSHTIIVTIFIINIKAFSLYFTKLSFLRDKYIIVAWLLLESFFSLSSLGLFSLWPSRYSCHHLSSLSSTSLRVVKTSGQRIILSRFLSREQSLLFLPYLYLFVCSTLSSIAPL